MIIKFKRLKLVDDVQTEYEEDENGEEENNNFRLAPLGNKFASISMNLNNLILFNKNLKL
jgi:hypothetical protein